MKNNKFCNLLLIIIYLNIQLVISDDCVEPSDSDLSSIEECVDTEYESYINCVRKRIKRNINNCGSVVDSCDSCNCNYCSMNGCDSHCNTCCGNFQQQCETKYCCYKTCHSHCGNQGCRDSCRKTCTEKLIEKASSQVVQTPNITTIINLHNKINNTNIIDVPINLKTDNINNITINTNEHNNSRSGQCCQIVSPRQCAPTSEYPYMKCFHLRKKTCGDICKANIMHAQPHQICDQMPNGPANCHNQIIYIPQPQPRCVYKADWPYVSCGIPPANCDGCYEHFLNNGPRPENCPGTCYGQGYGVGPYPSVPFYRPGIAPPSYIPPYYNGYGLPVGGTNPMYGAAPNPMPIPYSGVGYAPSTYDSYFSVQTNPEVPELTAPPIMYDPVSGQLSNGTHTILPINAGNIDPLQASQGIAMPNPVRYQRMDNEVTKGESEENEIKNNNTNYELKKETLLNQTKKNDAAIPSTAFEAFPVAGSNNTTDRKSDETTKSDKLLDEKVTKSKKSS